MPGLVPGIHDVQSNEKKTCMPGDKPGHDEDLPL